MGISSLLSAIWTLFLIGMAVSAGMTIEQHAGWIFTVIDLPSFLAIPLGTQVEASIMRVLSGVVGGFLTFFAIAYILPALLDAVRLGLVNRALRVAGKKRAFEEPNQAPLTWHWAYYPLFTRLWRDYAETLHGQRHPEAKPDEERMLFRSTMPAELYFNPQTLVDTPMRVEFFRHLPGILTGTGIVSTFAGILYGLTEFNPMVAPDQVTAQLKNLFAGVSTAFVASFFAIFAAIVVTIIEKFLLHWRYAQVVFLQSQVDDLFRGGTESDYLAELVKGVEVNRTLAAAANQFLPRFSALLEAKQNEIPTEQRLELLLQNLMQQMSINQGEMVKRLSETIHGSLAEPLQQMVQVMREGFAQQHKELQVMREGLAQQQEERQAWQSVTTLLAGMADKLELMMAGGAAQGAALQEELTASRRGLEENLRTLLTLLEAQGNQGQQVTGQLDQALVQGDQISAGVAGLRDELVRQGELTVAANEKSLALLVNEIVSAMKTLVEAGKDSAKERDAFLLARLSASQGELAAHMRDSFANGLEKPVQEIVSTIQTVREEQVRQSAQLSESLLNAFAAHLRQTVGALVDKLDNLGQRIETERHAMEETIRHLLDGMTEAARAGGDQLAVQMEKALAGAELRQDGLLEALTRFTADMRIDLNLLQQRIQQTSQEITSSVTDQTHSLLEQSGEARDAQLKQTGEHLLTDLKETLRRLASEGNDRDRERDALLLGRMEHDSIALMQQIRQSFTESEENVLLREMEREEQEEARTDRVLNRIEQDTGALADQFREGIQALDTVHAERDRQRDAALYAQMTEGSAQVAEQLRTAFLDGLGRTGQQVVEAVKESSAQQKMQTKELVDMLLLSMADKVEGIFGHLANGLGELRSRLDNERETIQKSLQLWGDDLMRTNQDDAKQLAEKIRLVMVQAEERHDLIMGAIQQFGTGLESDLGRMQEGLLQHGEKTAQQTREHLEQLQNGLLQQSEQAVQQGRLHLEQVKSGLLQHGEENALRGHDHLEQVKAGLLQKNTEGVEQLAKHVDEVVTITGHEQMVFTEMLGERLDTLRKQLRIK